jgi:hypothetical protein
MKKRRYRFRLLIFIAIILLFPGFYRNQWRVVDPEWFSTFNLDSEEFIYGRLAKSQGDGVFSSSGLAGKVLGVDSQKKAYLNGLGFTGFDTYDSQIGFQGILFGLFDLATPFSPAQNLLLFRLFDVALAVAVITCIIAWFYVRFGFLSALLALFSAAISIWLTLFARTFWWSLWSFYIPLLASLILLETEKRIGKIPEAVVPVVVFCAVYIKCLFNGYEYIATILVMMLVPYVYYAIRDQWSLKKITVRTGFVVLGAGLAILLSLFILAYQVSLVRGGWSAAIQHILEAFGKRTYGDPASYNEIYRPSLESSLGDVLLTYLKGIFFDLNRYFPIAKSWVAEVLTIRYQDILFVLILVSALSVLWIRNQKPTSELAIELKALLGASWFSLLAPLSWFVLFKAHAFAHTHIDNIVWQMPFTLFVFAAGGFLLQLFFISCPPNWLRKAARILAA